MDCIQGVGDLFLTDADLFGNLHNSRFLGIFAGQSLPGIDGFVRCIPEGTADPDGTGVIPQITPHFSHDHGNCIGGKLNVLVYVEIVDGFDQPDAPDLKEIIHIFITAGKPLDYA